MLTLRIDTSAFRRRVDAALSRLHVNLRGGVLDAAKQGINEAKRNHPYTDRTGTLSGYRESEDGGATSAEQVDGLPDGEEAADMVWPPDYASFVDKGTSRSRAYPYTPQAREHAEKALQRNTERAVESFERTFRG